MRHANQNTKASQRKSPRLNPPRSKVKGDHARKGKGADTLTQRDRARLRPGSEEALTAGCKCPVLDNCRGKGYMGIPSLFVYSENCPVHTFRMGTPLEPPMGALLCDVNAA